MGEEGWGMTTMLDCHYCGKTIPYGKRYLVNIRKRVSDTYEATLWDGTRYERTEGGYETVFTASMCDRCLEEHYGEAMR